MSADAGTAYVKIRPDTTGMAAAIARGMAIELRELADVLDNHANAQDAADEGGA